MCCFSHTHVKNPLHSSAISTVRIRTHSGQVIEDAQCHWSPNECNSLQYFCWGENPLLHLLHQFSRKSIHLQASCTLSRSTLEHHVCRKQHGSQHYLWRRSRLRQGCRERARSGGRSGAMAPSATWIWIDDVFKLGTMDLTWFSRDL